MAEFKHSDGTPVFLRLIVDDDIEFQTPEQFDYPTEADLERERLVAIALDKWADDYELRMKERRERWMNEGWHTLETV